MTDENYNRSSVATVVRAFLALTSVVRPKTRTNKLLLLFLDYENKYQQTEQGIMDDCESVPEMRPQDVWNRACRFDINNLGESCVKQQSFGFEDGQPCVLMKLNRVFLLSVLSCPSKSQLCHLTLKAPSKICSR